MTLIHTEAERAERIRQGLPYAIAPAEALEFYAQCGSTPPEWLAGPLFWALSAVVVDLGDRSIRPLVATN